MCECGTWSHVNFHHDHDFAVLIKKLIIRHLNIFFFERKSVLGLRGVLQWDPMHPPPSPNLTTPHFAFFQFPLGVLEWGKKKIKETAFVVL